MAITYVGAGTYLTEASGTSAVLVPPATALNDIVIVFLYKENTNAVTPAAGFTEFSHNATTGTQDHDSYLLWKRATASEPASHTFSWTTSNWRTGFVVAFRGCITTGSPVDVVTSATTGSTASTTTPAVQVTTTGADRMLAWFGSTWEVTAWTTPTGLTAEAPGSAPATRLTHGAYANQVAAGLSASYQTTTTQSYAKVAHLLALIPAPAPGLAPPPDRRRRRLPILVR